MAFSSILYKWTHCSIYSFAILFWDLITLYLSSVCPFLLLSNILLYRFTKTCLFYSLIDGHWVVSRFWQLKTKLLWPLAYKSLCYQPSPVKPQQGSSCPVSPLTVEGDRVRFKGKWKLYSLIREWRDASSPCSTHSPQQADRPWAWLLYGDLVEGAGCVGGSSHWAGADVLLVAFIRISARCSPSALSPPPPSWIKVSYAASLHTAGAEVSGAPVLQWELCWSAGCEVFARGSLWTSGTRLNTKEKKKVRLFFITQLLLFSGNC